VWKVAVILGVIVTLVLFYRWFMQGYRDGARNRRSAPPTCPNCGWIGTSADRYCRTCGSALGAASQSPLKIRELRETVREVVKVRCRYCGALYDEVKDKCPNCGGR